MDQQQAVQKIVKKTLFLLVFSAILLILAFVRPGQTRHFVSPIAQKQTLEIKPNSSQDEFFALDFSEQNSPELLALKGKINSESAKNLATEQIIYAFLPYWNINSLNKIDERINVLNYFRIGINGEGLIDKGDDEDEIGWRTFEGEKWQKLSSSWLAKNEKNRLEVTFFMDNTDDLEKLLTSEEKIDTLVLATHNFLLENPEVKGINLDFEYLGSGEAAVRGGMSNLLKKLRLLIAKEHGKVRLTLDIMAKSGYKEAGIYDWPVVVGQVDYVIMMAYDYKTRSSSVPGPVAPTLGKEHWGDDIFDSLKNILNKVPNYQVIMAVPFYGYQWQVTDFDLDKARTYPETGQTVIYRKIDDLLRQASDLGIEAKWDTLSLTPYLTYEEAEKKYMLFYENHDSLNYKMDLVRGLNLAGVGAWALGYEGDQSEFWDVLTK